MFFTNEKKQEICNKDKGVVSMIIPDSKMKLDECVRHDVEIIHSPLGAITRDAVSDSEVAKVLNRWCKYEDTVDYD